MTKYIALQFYGLIRGFRFEKTKLLFYERIIKQLENQGFKIHIFWHTYDILDQEVYNNTHTNLVKNKNDVKQIIELLDKKKFDIKSFEIDSDIEQQNWLENIYKLENNYKFYNHWSKDNKYGWFKFTYSMKKVNKLRQDYEKKNNIKYDWIILTSPQMEPQNNIDNLTLLDNKFMYSPGYAFYEGYYSSFLLGNSQHINYLSDLWDYMIKKKWNNDDNKNYIYFKNNLINSEPIFKQYIDSKYKMKSILNVRFHRVRYNGTRICH